MTDQKVKVLIEVEVDVEAWAAEHEVAPADVKAVVRNYFTGLSTIGLAKVSDVRDPGEFADRDALSIKRSLSAMPYSGLVMHLGSPCDVAALVRWLDAMAEVLRGTAKRTNEEAERLRRIEGDVAAMRRVFGLPPAPAEEG